MLKNISSEGSVETTQFNYSSDSTPNKLGENDWYGGEADQESIFSLEDPCRCCISVGDYLPYGAKFYYNYCSSSIRMKDIGEKRRVLLLGVVGSFTPYCWNRHLYRVMSKFRYYQERGIDYICCISTNDAPTHTAWATFLGCQSTIFMLADVTKHFTTEIGMNIVLPWLDDNVRSKRYIIFAENMMVTKMIVAADDGPILKWNCDHLLYQENEEDDNDEDSSGS